MIELFGEEGRDWLDRLPAMLAACEERWNLTIGAPVGNLSFNYVAPAVRADGTEVMLKAGLTDEFPSQPEALRHFNGHGMVQLLELTNRPGTIGFQADMAHTLLYTLGYNAPEDRILPENWNWSDPAKLDSALATLTAALRPWTIDFHVAQNDATVKGSGSHDKTGRHCLPNDPNGKLKIAHHAGYWLRDSYGNPTRKFKHICWDGCMFPNDVMMKPQTWNDILKSMIDVRNEHGWRE